MADGSFDAAILAVGVPELANIALNSLRKEGKLNLFAGFSTGAAATIDPNGIHYRQVHVTGASESRRRDFAEGLALVASGHIDLAPLVTQRFALRDYEQAFAAAADGSSLKVAFQM